MERRDNRGRRAGRRCDNIPETGFEALGTERLIDGWNICRQA